MRAGISVDYLGVSQMSLQLTTEINSLTIYEGFLNLSMQSSQSTGPATADREAVIEPHTEFYGIYRDLAFLIPLRSLGLTEEGVPDVESKGGPRTQLHLDPSPDVEGELGVVKH